MHVFFLFLKAIWLNILAEKNSSTPRPYISCTVSEVSQTFGSDCLSHREITEWRENCSSIYLKLWQSASSPALCFLTFVGIHTDYKDLMLVYQLVWLEEFGICGTVKPNSAAFPNPWEKQMAWRRSSRKLLLLIRKNKSLHLCNHSWKFMVCSYTLVPPTSHCSFLCRFYSEFVSKDDHSSLHGNVPRDKTKGHFLGKIQQYSEWL